MEADGARTLESSGSEVHVRVQEERGMQGGGIFAGACARGRWGESQPRPRAVQYQLTLQKAEAQSSV